MADSKLGLAANLAKKYERPADNFTLDNLFGVKGKVALITGGGSGIGKMMASGLVVNGAKVYIAARKMDLLQEACDDLNKVARNGGSCIAIRADIKDKAGCDALAAEIKKRESHLNILINNSGTSWGSKIDQVPEDNGWDKVYNLNVKSIFFLTIALMPLLEKNASRYDPNRVINISSPAGVSANAKGTVNADGEGMWSYNSSKAAVVALTRNLACDLTPKFITVNGILPGIYPSRLTAFGISQHEKQMIEGQPMGRIGEPEDIAGLALFLVSRAGAHISGQNILSEGGSTLGRL